MVVKGLHKSYGEQKVLNGLDLTVGSGQTVAVLGRSGTGKSVLLRLIVGLQKPDAGTIQIQGQEITHANLEEMNEIRKKMGFLFLHAALYGSLTVEENIAFPLRRHTEMTAAQRSERVQQSSYISVRYCSNAFCGLERQSECSSGWLVSPVIQCSVCISTLLRY
jgi:phospholipid/cholesterol/gamma-HCH transport system ATP-binding protein